MIAFQHVKSGLFLRSKSDWSHAYLLCDAYPWHEIDEANLREKLPALAEYRTAPFSTRIDHPLNDLSKLSSAELAERYPT